jgi:hypothetical protein
VVSPEELDLLLYCCHGCSPYCFSSFLVKSIAGTSDPASGLSAEVDDWWGLEQGSPTSYYYYMHAWERFSMCGRYYHKYGHCMCGRYYCYNHCVWGCYFCFNPTLQVVSYLFQLERLDWIQIRIWIACHSLLI